MGSSKDHGGPEAQAGGFHYEFFGPYGPALIVLALPAVVAGLVYACNPEGCLQLWPSLQVPGFPAGMQLYEHEAMLAVVAWFLLIFLLHKLLPGQTVQGVKLPSGGKLSYKLNGEPQPQRIHNGQWHTDGEHAYTTQGSRVLLESSMF